MSGAGAVKDAWRASIPIKSADRMEAQRSGEAAVRDAWLAAHLAAVRAGGLTLGQLP